VAVDVRRTIARLDHHRAVGALPDIALHSLTSGSSGRVGAFMASVPRDVASP
jgi:hypothetical protein